MMEGNDPDLKLQLQLYEQIHQIRLKPKILSDQEKEIELRLKNHHPNSQLYR